MIHLDYFIETVVYKKPLADFHGMNNMWPFIEVKKLEELFWNRSQYFNLFAQPTIRDS